MSRDTTAESKSSKKTISPKSARAQLDKQIVDFLKSGGKIQQIPNGIAAGVSTANRQKPRTMKGSPPKR